MVFKGKHYSIGFAGTVLLSFAGATGKTLGDRTFQGLPLLGEMEHGHNKVRIETIRSTCPLLMP